MTGGHPTNYSETVRVLEACSVKLRGLTQSLQLRFVNGVRNMHVQGAGFPEEGPCDLALELYFDDAPQVAQLPLPPARALCNAVGLTYDT